MRKILIVDDEHEVSLAGRVFSKRRYTIIPANSTKEALALVVEDDIWALFITQHRLAADEGLTLALTAANAGVMNVAFLADSVPETLDRCPFMINNESLILLSKGYEYFREDGFGRDWRKILADLTTDGPMVLSMGIRSDLIDVIDTESAGTFFRNVIIVDNELEADIARRVLSAWHYEVTPVKTVEDIIDFSDGIWALLITRHGLTVDEGLSLVLEASFGGIPRIALLSDSVPETLDRVNLTIQGALVFISKGDEYVWEDGVGRNWEKIFTDLFTIKRPAVISMAMAEIR